MAKKLLNEATVRRFQSLANLKPINETYKSYEEDMKEKEEEKMEEGVYEEKADEVMKEEEEMEAEMGAEAPEMEMEAGAEEDAMGDMNDVELTDEEAQMIIELGKKLAAAMGEEEGEEMEMDAEEAPEMEMSAEDELMEALADINYVPSQTEVVNEVARRVARRLAEAQKAEKLMNEALGRK